MPKLVGRLGTGRKNWTTNYLCIIACEDLQCDWSNELSDEMKPNILQPDLLHMNIVSWDIFITTRYAAILETTLIY